MKCRLSGCGRSPYERFGASPDFTPERAGTEHSLVSINCSARSIVLDTGARASVPGHDRMCGEQARPGHRDLDGSQPQLTNPTPAETMIKLPLYVGLWRSLGARFHGMEEVIGSIPIRSTNYFKHLAPPPFRDFVASLSQIPKPHHELASQALPKPEW